MIEVLRAGALATVQDLGRHGCLRFGVGTAGAMDDMALVVGNLLLGNPPGAAGIEVQVLPFQARFLQACEFALTGADIGARLDGKPILPWWMRRAEAGQVLDLAGSAGAARGARSYLTLRGGVDVPVVLGSRSTHLRGRFGGHEGRALAKGDVLRAGACTAPAGRPDAAPQANRLAGFGVEPPAVALCAAQAQAPWSAAAADAALHLRVVPAAEYECFDQASLAAFWSNDWKIQAQSDRYGYRLGGPALTLKHALETRSHGIVPGVVQVPHGGQPIIQMRDAQPSGGYPKIGTVIEADIWRLAQAPTGSRIRFVRTDYDGARAASAQVDAYLDQLAREIAAHRLVPC